MSILRVVHDTFGERTARVGEVKANIKKIVSWTPPSLPAGASWPCRARDVLVLVASDSGAPVSAFPIGFVSHPHWLPGKCRCFTFPGVEHEPLTA